MKLDYQLKTTVDFRDSTINQELTKATETLYRWVCNTRDVQVREALIKLGWTPPTDSPRCACGDPGCVPDEDLPKT